MRIVALVGIVAGLLAFGAGGYAIGRHVEQRAAAKDWPNTKVSPVTPAASPTPLTPAFQPPPGTVRDAYGWRDPKSGGYWVDPNDPRFRELTRNAGSGAKFNEKRIMPCGHKYGGGTYAPSGTEEWCVQNHRFEYRGGRLIQVAP